MSVGELSVGEMSVGKMSWIHTGCWSHPAGQRNLGTARWLVGRQRNATLAWSPLLNSATGELWQTRQMMRSPQRDFQLRLRDMLKPPAAENGSQASECGGATHSVADEREEGECGMEPPLSYLGSLMRGLKKTVDLGPAVNERLAADMKTLLTEELHVPVLEELKTKFPRPENMPELVVCGTPR